MTLLVDAFQHSGWATARLGGACRGLTEPALEARPGGLYASPLAILKHLVEAEFRYLELLGIHTTTARGATLEDLLADAAEAAERYAAYAATASTEQLGHRFHMARLKSDFTVQDGLLQVLTHSAAHRGELGIALSLLGRETPPTDYVIYRLEHGAST